MVRILGAVSLTAALAMSGCAFPRSGGSPPFPAGAGVSLTFEEIAQAPPSFSWERSVLEREKRYFVVPSLGSEPSFFFSPEAFQYFDPEKRLLKYQRNELGFTLMEIRKRRGVVQTPDCPVILPLVSCREDHHLLIAYVVDCRESCTYRAVVYDAFSPIRIMPLDPPVMQIMRHLMNRSDVLRDDRITITHEVYGVLDEGETSWKKYVEEQVAFTFDRAARTGVVEVHRHPRGPLPDPRHSAVTALRTGEE